MFNWKSQYCPGKVSGLQIETDDIDKFHVMEKAAQNCIDNQLDAVEVVRCKDCKHWDDREGIGWCECNSSFDMEGLTWNGFYENDFCSHGERK